MIDNKKKKSSTLTFFILPNDSSKGKKYTVSVKRYKLLRNVAIVFVLSCVFALFNYGNMSYKVTELKSVKKENTEHKIELQALASKINDLETSIAKLKLFDKKLRILANIEKPVPSDGEHTGMGGFYSDSDYLLSIDERRLDLIGRVRHNLNQLQGEVATQEASFTELQQYLLEQSTLLSSTPSIWPTRGWVTSSFGSRTDPFTGRTRKHKGMDIANRVGTPVIAPADGIVTRVVRSSSLGKMVEISHGYGIKTRYAHLSEVLVKVGTKIKRGEKIAKMGNTGKSTGPHLHYEVMVNSVSVSPSKYILN